MRHTRTLAAVLALGILVVTFAVRAGNSGSTQPMYPTGSGANIAFGDWVSTNSGAALNTYYSFFVEVPPNQSQLTIDIFDPDILQGGAAAEEAAGRDRARTGAMTAGYAVRRPNGTAIPTLFTVGDAATPAGGDNAWVTLLSFSGDYVRDEINATSFAGNDGTLNWASDWSEIGDNGNPATGRVTFTGGDITVNPRNTTRGVQRTADLSAFTTASLTFDASSTNTEAGDTFEAQVSYNGGAFTTIASFTGALALGSQGPYPITVGSANTVVRFLRTAGYDSNNEIFEIDNVQIKDSAVPNGHWEVRVDQSSAFTTSDDLNAFAIRAHDGNAGAGGTELNVYADNMISVGAHPNQTTTYRVHPWVTSGCQCAINDFDVDSNSTTTASMTVTNRTSTFTQTFGNATLSPDNTWNRDLTSAFTTADTATGYGIWQWDVNVPFYTGNGNYATIYLSSDQAPANPPASNPVANSFRTYFPTDAGAAPVKPYLEQLLTFNNIGTATNPPTAGQTATYTVTVRFVNPTPRSVTFSAPARLVTANVPGSGVTYAGFPQVSQGSLVSQPAIGGTGNVTWNPGTVAAGATILLSYRVQVLATGATMTLTGTPASNGSRAVYLDETANAAQARATSTVGPICELTIGALATDAVVSSLDASKDKGRVTVIWTTSSELGTASFDLLREEKAGFVAVNSEPIPALYTNAAGGSYAVDDPGANGGRQTWAVRETTVDGRTILHGPFTVTPRPPQAADPKADGVFGSKPNASVQSKPKPKATSKTTATALVAETSTRGIHSISATDISAILGMPIGAVEAKIRSGSFRLTKGSASVAWTPAPAGDAILFYAEEIDSPYTTRTAWVLTEGDGSLMTAESVSPAALGATSYLETRWFESDNFAATAVPLDPEGDYWFQESFVPGYAGYTTKTIPVQVDALASTADGTLAVKLQGATAATHSVKVRLNDVEVATSTWDGITPVTVSGAIPAGLLRVGANSVTIEGVKNVSGPLSAFYLDAIGVTWRRPAVPVEGRLELEASGPTTVGALASTPLLFDVTDPLRPVTLSGLMLDASGSVSWNAAPGHRYALATTDAVRPASTRASRAADLSGVRAADMLIITSAGLHDAAETYAQYRRSTGLAVEVVDVEAIYDAVTGGLETPHAIRSFLRQASQWPLAPRYVLLAGRGTYDYKGIAGELPLVPPLMVRSPDGIFASDARLADVDGDGAPDFAIGRLPASDADELLAYLAKVEQLEDAGSRNPALFAADDPDRGVVFARASGSMQGTIPSGSTLRIVLKETPLASARMQLFGAWASGLSIVNWTGHGGIDRLASEGLLTSTDVPGLTSGTPPVLVALSCVINRFELPGYPTLGEQLVLSETGGAAATWAPTGLANHDASAALGDTFYRGLAAEADARVGDLVRAAATAHPGAASELYVLLGDPTLRIRMPVNDSPSSNGE